MEITDKERAFVVGMMHGDEAAACGWLAKLDERGETLTQGLQTLIDRRKRGLPLTFD